MFESTDERRQIRVHDLRATMITVSLADGRSEAWISDRTRHRSSQMIARYKRTARTFAELQTGELSPLSSALPDLRLDTVLDMVPVTHRNHWRPQRDLNPCYRRERPMS